MATFNAEAQSHAARTIAALRAESERLRAACTRYGYRVSPSDTQFFLFGVANAADAQRALLERDNLLVRDCSSFGLPNDIRVAARTPA